MASPAIAAFLRKLYVPSAPLRPSAFNVVRRACQCPDRGNLFNSFAARSVRFSLRVGIPTIPVFADQIFVGFRQVGDLPGLTIVKQFLARPQGDGVKVNGL